MSLAAERALHPWAWLVWVTGVLVTLATMRNPWCLGLILAAVAAAYLSWARRADGPEQPVMLSPVRLGLVVIAFSTVFNAAMVHYGETVILTLPAAWPLIGGPITLEAMVYGALNGLALAVLLAAFAVINRVVPVRAALRLVPRAYYPVAVVVSIAVTFVPTTLHQVQQVREAQAVRGQRLRGLRSWLPLVIPVLEGSLERSMQLAEAMMARGFASAEAAADVRPQLLALSGLAVVMIGWLARLFGAWALWGTGLLIAGGLCLLAGLWLAGRRHPHTVYRPDRWHWQDGVVIAGAVLAAAVYAFPLPGLERSSLYYYPYPALTWPPFSPLIGLATLGLLAPAVLRGRRPADGTVAEGA